MKCEVCGGKIWPDDYLKAYLCAGHLRQAEECINILKGEKGFIPYKEVPSGYGDVPLVEWGASDKPLWVMVNGVKFVPEKPKVWYAAEKDEDGYGIWRHDTGADTITFYTQIGNEQAEALYNQMRRERGEPDERD